MKILYITADGLHSLEDHRPADKPPAPTIYRAARRAFSGMVCNEANLIDDPENLHFVERKYHYTGRIGDRILVYEEHLK